MYYYTNFIYETNGWWLRRVRPIWMGATLAWCYWLLHRYYFFGKISVKNQRKIPESQHIKLAAFNKRNFGWNNRYKPTLEISIKKQIMDAMGDSYDYAFETEDYNLVVRTFEQMAQIRQEENEY